MAPLYLGDEVEENVTVAQFCVSFLLIQRSRRGGTSLIHEKEEDEYEPDLHDDDDEETHDTMEERSAGTPPKSRRQPSRVAR